MISHSLRRLTAGLLTTALATSLLLAAPSATAKPPVATSAAGPTITNAISKSFADTFADPSVIQGKDGWWYAYSTADPLRSGEEPGVMHIARTKDWVTWDYQGTVFDETNRPDWASRTSGLWAPDVRYVDGQYVIYYTVTDTTLNDRDDSAIGVATAPTPTGPWTPGDAPVVAPRPQGASDFLWTFDPSQFTDIDGKRYLYYGSYFGGLFVTELSADGMTAVGTPTRVAIDNRYEGSYVVRHDGWYYLMASSANCCAGPTTGYSVFSGRSKSPLGPFVDADGLSLLDSKVGGTIMLTQNGNRWIGAGHHAIATDASGRDYVVYHALDRDNAWLNEPFGITRRPMLMDRLDWIDGWPRTRAGLGPSDTRQAAPVSGSLLGIRADDPAGTGFRGLQQGPVDAQAGKTARLVGSATTLQKAPGKAVRLRLDVRGDQPLAIDLGSGRTRVLLSWVAGKLRLTTTDGHQVTTRAVPATPKKGWQALTVEVNGSTLVAALSESDLNDPYAEVRLVDKGFRLPMAAVRLTSLPVRGTTPLLVDNVSINKLAKETTKLAATPKAGKLIKSEEFNGTSHGLTWVRPDAAAVVGNGALQWPVQQADLVGGGNNAGVLLTQAPKGDWIAETKVTLDLGADEIRNYQQAGLIAYQNDEDFARLSTVAIWNTRQTEFGRERVAAPDGRTSFGGALIGTPAATVWLRLAHSTNAAGEHLYRAGTSRDGKAWTWGAVWTFEAGTNPRIGLIAHGGENPTAVAEFDHLRFYSRTDQGR